MPDRNATSLGPDSLAVFRDGRGALTLTDFDALAFAPARAFVLHDIPAGARRAGHAHRAQHRYLAVISGRTRVVVDDGSTTQTVMMGAGESLHVPPGVWHELKALDDGLLVLVLASGPHDPADYVHGREELAVAAAATAAQTSST